MKWLFAIVLFLIPSVAFGQLTEEDIKAITDSITVRALEMQAMEADDEIHRSMDVKLDQVLINQAGFQALVKLYITQEMRRNALRDVIAESRSHHTPVHYVAASANSCGRKSGGMFRMFARGRF